MDEERCIGCWTCTLVCPFGAIRRRYSGGVLLREEFDKDLLRQELGELGLSGPISRVSNPWYCRKKNTDTWIKIGEPADRDENFPVRWDTTNLENGQYEVMGLMHIFVKRALRKGLSPGKT